MAESFARFNVAAYCQTSLAVVTLMLPRYWWASFSCVHIATSLVLIRNPTAPSILWFSQMKLKIPGVAGKDGTLGVLLLCCPLSSPSHPARPLHPPPCLPCPSCQRHPRSSLPPWGSHLPLPVLVPASVVQTFGTSHLLKAGSCCISP